MGKMMHLAEVVRDLDSYDDELTIYVYPPWTPMSPAIVATEESDGTPPSEAKDQEMLYFLETFVARGFLKDWIRAQSQAPSLEEKCERLIQYATNDA